MKQWTGIAVRLLFRPLAVFSNLRIKQFKTSSKSPAYLHLSKKTARAAKSAASAPQTPGQDLQALRPMLGNRISGSTPNSDRAGAGGAATAWPDVRARTDGARQWSDSTGADTDSTSAATAAKPAATACDESRPARRRCAGGRRRSQRIGWHRYRPR